MDQEITLTDLAKMRTIIEVACSRGAFQANEMRSVGETYDRLIAFLNSVLAQAEQADPDTTEPKEKSHD